MAKMWRLSVTLFLSNKTVKLFQVAAGSTKSRAPAPNHTSALLNGNYEMRGVSKATLRRLLPAFYKSRQPRSPPLQPGRPPGARQLMNGQHAPIPIGGSEGGGLAMGMGAGCRTPGRAPVRAGTPIRQHAPIAPSLPPMGMGVCCSFITRCDVSCECP